MASVDAPPAPQPDPKVLAEQQAEARRARQERIAATQQQLALETSQRNQNFGIRSLLGFTPLGAGRRGLTSLLGSG